VKDYGYLKHNLAVKAIRSHDRQVEINAYLLYNFGYCCVCVR